MINELFVFLILGSLFSLLYGMIQLIERIQWKAGDRK